MNAEIETLFCWMLHTPNEPRGQLHNILKTVYLVLEAMKDHPFEYVAMREVSSNGDQRRLHEAEHKILDPVEGRGLAFRDGNQRRFNDGSGATKHPVAHLRGSSGAIRRWGRADDRQKPGLDSPGESLLGGFPKVRAGREEGIQLE